MEVKVGSYYNDPAREHHQEIHVTLTDEDGLSIWPREWGGWDFNTQFSKLTAMADVKSLQYAIDRGYIDTQHGTDRIKNIIIKYLKR